MSSKVTHLDRLAAQHAQAIIANTKSKKANDVENTVTKALGVLQENGVYACFLYLLAKEKENGKEVVKEMLNLLEGLGFGWDKPTSNKPEDILSYIIEKVTVDLERLLLVKETLEQMLIYARYAAKARQEEEKKDEQEASS
ncbi:hypothetical protein Cylst_6366 (plasmid) [Cylindrospermum stagnale PCC 7417]|uniref:CRISPR type III-B/RAMP module-associated protein Cmr5 n=1 Tax=Cylindrospermum stagnale PCC 7417 TaxID=56107 RepID=K9X962_9NOST|nr:hypothetical protein [Cylindrospermum stagnale]AFZ28586.1 hypothetical protein Cylst_6366 [Cylindrospermum stagnale PCC 7417]